MSNFPDPQLVDTNGIQLAVYEQGSGPAVILLHGFPELAYSWRHQLPALAAAGYRAIAPDQRGYGYSDCPAGVERYTIHQLIGDILGLLDWLGLNSASFVGHDWGALVLWQLALLEPERIDRMAILNVPFRPRPPTDPIDLARTRLGDDFYIVNFQDSDEADRAFSADPAHFFTMMMRRNQISRERFEQLPKSHRVLSLLATMARTESGGEPLLSDAELEYFVNAYSRSGFTGPINWYRNWSHNWATTADVEQTVTVPTLFIGAVDDVVIPLHYIDDMKRHVTDLEIIMLDNCGHWTQQEHPERVNELLLEWLDPDRQSEI